MKNTLKIRNMYVYVRYSIHMFRYLELYRTRMLISFFSIERRI